MTVDGRLHVVPKQCLGMTIRSKQVPTGSGNYYMYEQKSRRAGKKVATDHVRYIGKGHHGAYQGPSQAVVPNGTNPTFIPSYRLGGLSRFDAAPTKDPFPSIKEKAGPAGQKNAVSYTQLANEKGEIEIYRQHASSINDLEGYEAKVIRDQGRYFYVQTRTRTKKQTTFSRVFRTDELHNFGPQLKTRKAPGGGKDLYTPKKSDKFNNGQRGITASEAKKAVVPKAPSKLGPTKTTRGDPKPIPKAESKPVVPKAKGSSSASASGSQKDARANAIDASFTVKEGSGA